MTTAAPAFNQIPGRRGARMRGWYHAGLGRAASTVLALLAAPACASHPPATSDTAPSQKGGTAEADAGDQRSRPREWSRMAEVRAWAPVNETPFVSLGHPPGNQLARIHVSPEAQKTYQNLLPGTTLPIGAVVAELQQDPAGGQPGLSYVMTKVDAERWEFMLVGADGQIHERGDVPPCVRCHAEAPTDSLFGVPTGD